MRLKISARKSDLARLQAYSVGEALGVEIEYQFRESLGDKNLNDPLWKMPEKGVFTEDFQKDLLEGKTDIVVHSWKDLPLFDKNAPTEIIATLNREDCRDLLLFKKSSLPKLQRHRPLKIFSSSPRRQYNLTPFLQDYLPYGNQKVEFLPVRGNIQTRVKKMLEEDNVDGLILAKAALDRLLQVTREEFSATKIFLKSALEECAWMVLPLSENPTAAAQGALAIEALKNREDLKLLFKSVQDSEAFSSVCAERETLSRYGGGCHQKIGVSVLTRFFGNVTFLKGLTDKGEVLSSKPANPVPGLVIVKSEDLFVRRNLKATVPNDVDALFVSHVEAFVDVKGKVLWTSGLRTWKKLADLGHWVHGSAESLGEAENRRLEALAPNLKWAKLSHQSPAPSELPVISTYELTPKASVTLPEASAYYWKSALLYKQALSLQPELIHKKHYCGPGKTFEEIQKMNSHISILFPAPKG